MNSDPSNAIGASPVADTLPESTGTLKQRAMFSTAWYGGSRLAIQAISWLITLAVARLLKPSDYGLLGFALLAMGFGDLVSELSLGSALIQKQKTDPEDLDVVFWSAVLINIGLVGVLITVAPFVAVYFQQPQVAPVLRVLSLSYLLGAARVVPNSLLRKRVDFKRVSLCEVGARITGACVTLALAYRGFEVWSLVYGIVLQQAALSILSFWLCPWVPHFRFSFKRLRQMAAFGTHMSLSRFFFFVYSSADYFVVGKFLGPTALGIYTLAFQLSMVVADKLATVINQVGFPVYSELLDQPERAKRYFLKTLRLLSIAAFPIVTGLGFVADIAVPTLLPPKWVTLVGPLQIMCWTGLVMTMVSVLAPICHSKGRADLSAKFCGVCCVVLPLGFWFGTRYGIIGVCWAWAILYPLLAAGWYERLRPLVGYSWSEVATAIKPALASTVAMLVPVLLVKRFLPQSVGHFTSLISIVGIGALTYALFFKWLFPSVLFEIKGLVSLKE